MRTISPVQPGLLHNLLTVAWPITVSEIAGTLGPTFDMIWIGRLGSASLAGAGMASAANGLMMNIMVGVMMGVRAMVARHVGAGQLKDAAHVAQQAFLISLVFGAVVAVLGFFFSEEVISLFGLSAVAAAEGAAFLKLMSLGVVVFSLRLAAESVMQASGDTMTPMKISVAHRSLNLALGPALVFGWVFPPLGVTGVALSNISTQALAVAVAVWVLSTGRTRLRLALRDFRVDLGVIKRAVTVGAPASANFVQNDLGGMAIMRIMAGYGTVAVAATVVVRRVEMVLFMPGAGLGTAAGIIAGQSLGASDTRRAARVGWIAAGLASGLGVLAAAVILLWAEPVAGIFNSEAGLVATTAVFLRIASVAYLMFGAIIVFILLLNAIGDTVPPMLILSSSMWLLAVLPAYLLPRLMDISLYGVRWIVVTPAVVTGLGLTLYFRSGRWLRRRL